MTRGTQYKGRNYRAAMLAQERRRRRELINKYYTYGSIAAISTGFGIYLGVMFTNGTW